MKDYAKIVLYAYPFLKTVERDYEEHIRNKAVLSFDSARSAEELAEYLAGELIEMRRLEWLKGRVGEALARLNEEELLLVEGRYFHKKKKLQALLADGRWTNRTYFRRQERVARRLAALLILAGVTEEVYVKEFAQMEIFQRIARGLEERRAVRCNATR